MRAGTEQEPVQPPYLQQDKHLMKSLAKQYETKAAFTIVELLTVMSIIVILIGLLVPALNNVKRYAFTVKQNAQFHSVNVALELFHYDFE